MSLKRLAVDTDEKVSLSVTITGRPEQVARVEALLSMISVNGSAGHSGIFGISWDGDGADYVEIEGIDTDKYRDLVHACCDHGGIVEFVDEGPIGRNLTAPDAQYKTVYPEPQS